MLVPIIYILASYTISFSEPSGKIKFGYFIFNPEFSGGEIIAILSIVITAIIAIITIKNSRKQERSKYEKEYADKIRSSAGITIAKMERWNELYLNFFRDLGPLILQADALLIEEDEINKSIEAFLNGLVIEHAKFSRRLFDEGVEIAYKDLYGYDSRIENIFTKSISNLNYIDQCIYRELYTLGQKDIMLSHKRVDKNTYEKERITKSFQRGSLGKRLRNTISNLALESHDLMNGVIEHYSKNMIDKIVNEHDDNKIFNKMLGDFSNSPVANDHAIRGLVFRTLGYYKEALECYNIAIALDSSIPGYFIGKGLTLRGLNDNECKRCISKAWELHKKMLDEGKYALIAL
jgi:tetratricopeptide (TPR) repeat protein